MLQASPLTFDPSVVEMFTTLSSGAILLLVPELLKMIPTQLGEIITNRQRVTIIQVCVTILCKIVIISYKHKFKHRFAVRQDN